MLNTIGFEWVRKAKEHAGKEIEDENKENNRDKTGSHMDFKLGKPERRMT